MKSRKNTMKRGGGGIAVNISKKDVDLLNRAAEDLRAQGLLNGRNLISQELEQMILYPSVLNELDIDILGGSKRKSRKSRKAKKTKKGRGAYEGGKKKCPKHCRRKTCRSRKRLKHRKN